MAVHPNSLKNLTLGREPKGVKRYNLTLEPELVAFAKKSGNASAFINELLRKAQEESKQKGTAEQRLSRLLEREKAKNIELREETERLCQNRMHWKDYSSKLSNELTVLKTIIYQWKYKADKTYNPKWHYAKKILGDIISLFE